MVSGGGLAPHLIFPAPRPGSWAPPARGRHRLLGTAGSWSRRGASCGPRSRV